MPRPLDSLRAQLVLLIVVALTAAQAISLWLFVDERSLAVRAALGFEAAGRAANVARLIEEAPPDLHASILRAANSPLVRFDLSDRPAVSHNRHSDGGTVEARVRALLGDSFSRKIFIELHEVPGTFIPMPDMPPEMMRMHSAMMGGDLAALEMNLSIALSGGRWLNVGTRFERPPLQWPWLSFLSFGVTAAIILIVVFWFLLTGLTGPLRRLARAADSLGRGEEVAPLPLDGPREVRDLSATFNRMQERLTRFVADRTRVLAALSHDLRSPLTALRVRAEMVEDDETRDGLIASIEEMQGMAEATLSFARGLAGGEPVETVELGAFLRQMRDDMLDAFALAPGQPVELRLRPGALRRALRNVIENALRYGTAANVSYRTDGAYARIAVADAGPGIPEADLEKVFEPFFRLERSRSRETGGYGLGLSIARTILRAHGGDVTLANAAGGGLVATLSLPLQGAPKPEEGT